MTRPIAVALITFLASVAGMVLQSVIPADVLNASKGPVGAMTGVIALARGHEALVVIAVFGTLLGDLLVPRRA